MIAVELPFLPFGGYDFSCQIMQCRQMKGGWVGRRFDIWNHGYGIDRSLFEEAGMALQRNTITLS